MALIRYPGSKDKLVREISAYFPVTVHCPLFNQEVTEYREPFFGAGAVGLRLMSEALSQRCAIWLNDKDPMMVALWQSVHKYPRQLCNLIQRFEPSAERFWEFKKSDDQPTGSTVEDGFRKLALHQMSFSGLGYMAGGPLGGKDQVNPAYNPSCRWRPYRLHKNITRLHNLFRCFRRLEITCEDFARVISTASDQAFVYIDPPYYEKGPQLYKHCMSQADHERLADCLRQSSATWVLSYDDNREVRRLYDGMRIEPIRVTYTTATARTEKRPKNREIVILKPSAK